LLDEFDEAYKNLPRETFAQLRAIRDANKRSVSYAVFLRNLPERLRAARDNESFYELMSRNMLGLGPYSKADTLQILQDLEARRGYTLTPADRDRFYEASGGHIGLIQAFLGMVIEDPKAAEKIGIPGWIDLLGSYHASLEECRKICEGLDQDELDALLAFAKGNQLQTSDPTVRLLFTKGLLQQKDQGTSFFSPVFERYIRTLMGSKPENRPGPP
jgi:hypothetical protein